MFRRLLATLLVLLTLAAPALGKEAEAQESTFAPAVRLVPTITVTLDGVKTAASVHVMQDGAHLLDAAPILEALDDDVVFDATESVLMVTRSQDGVTMSLYTDTGLVQANGKDLGRLESFGEVDESRVLLDPNAIAVLSGARGKYSEETKSYSFELDPRLKVATGFDISVEGENLLSVFPEPRSVGPVLLLPLLPIADALGSDVQVLDGGNIVQVRRAQDSALFEMDLSSGLIKLNGNPRGVALNVTYIDPVNLLLPSGAVEALTGTHVNMAGRSTLIEITLDDRLSGSVRPGARVADEVADTPFTVESLSFDIGLEQISEVRADFHVRGVNGRVRMEMPGLPTSSREATPSWLSLDFAHVDGLTGSLGDISAGRREVQSLGINRMRGLKVEKDLEEGRWSAVMGMPSRGAARISDTQSRVDFGGFAAGMRYADADGWEAGVAVAHDDLTRDQRMVLSLISNRLDITKDATGLLSRGDVAASADVGLFNGPMRERTPDVRFFTAASLDVSPVVRVDAFARYDGVEFLRTDLNVEDAQRRITRALTQNTDIEDEDAIPDLRIRGADRAEYGASVRGAFADRGSLRNTSASLRVEQTVTGVTVPDRRSTLSRVTGSVGSTFGETGINFSADATLFDLSGEAIDHGFAVGARAHKRFDAGTVTADYRLSDSDRGQRLEIATAQIAAKPYAMRLPRGATVNMGPVAGANLVNGRWSAQGGMTAQLDSGALLGELNRVTASMGVLQSVSPRGNARTTRYMSLDFARQLPIGDHLAVGIGARTDLAGDMRVGLQLRGRYDFNEARRYRRTEAEAGVLSGIAFLDSNRDGVRQPDERGLPGVAIRLHGTRYALRAGAGGAYTIQNLPQGLYEVRIEGDSLPLGYAQSEDSPNRASVGEGRITRLEIPVVARGQIRGSLYVDQNDNGEYDRGEARPEGERVTIEVGGETAESITSKFGQFAFDDLPSGTYTLSWKGIELKAIDLEDHPDLLAKVRVALPDMEHQEGAVSPEPAA